MNFYEKDMHLPTDWPLSDGTIGVRIQTKVKAAGQKTRTIGGIWTKDDKLFTFWD